jgi:hypothetical protein
LIGVYISDGGYFLDYYVGLGVLRGFGKSGGAMSVLVCI